MIELAVNSVYGFKGALVRVDRLTEWTPEQAVVTHVDPHGETLPGALPVGVKRAKLTPTIKLNDEYVTLDAARAELNVPAGECFGCYLGDAAPEMHDYGCVYGAGAVDA